VDKINVEKDTMRSDKLHNLKTQVLFVTFPEKVGGEQNLFGLGGIFQHCQWVHTALHPLHFFAFLRVHIRKHSREHNDHDQGEAHYHHHRILEHGPNADGNMFLKVLRLRKWSENKRVTNLFFVCLGR